MSGKTEGDTPSPEKRVFFGGERTEGVKIGHPFVFTTTDHRGHGRNFAESAGNRRPRIAQDGTELGHSILSGM